MKTPRLFLTRSLALLALFALAFSGLAAGFTPASGAAPTAPNQPTAPNDGSEPLPAGVTIETLLPGMVNPIAMAFDPAGRLFYTEKTTGNVRLFENGVLQTNPVITFNTNSSGERGLLGIAIDPDFNNNHFIYVYYTCNPAGGACPVTRNQVVRFVENNGVGSNPTTLFDSPVSGATNHNGGNIHFGADSKLYISVGDGGDTPQYAQDVTRKNGKMHRINPDGTIPSDNPVFTQTGALPSLYVMGLRNSFDFTRDPLDLTAPYRIFASENGPSCDDEMNRIEAGYNYGWRNVCEDTNPSPTYNTIPPLWYLPSGQCCEAPTGIIVYTGNQIPQWTGHIFMATYNNSAMRHFYPSADRLTVTQTNIIQGVSVGTDIETGPDGALWYIQGGGYSAGTLKRIVCSTCGGSTPTATAIVPTATRTNTAVPPSSTPIPPSSTPILPSSTPVPPSNTATSTNTPVPPSNTPIGPTATRTNTPTGTFIPPSNTPTVPTSTRTNTAIAPSATLTSQPTSTTVPASATRTPQATNTPAGPTSTPAVPTSTPAGSSPTSTTTSIVPTQTAAPTETATATPTVCMIQFTDVPLSNPFYSYVRCLACRDILSGYRCGGPNEPCDSNNNPYFRPYNTITRGQIAKVVSNAAGLIEDPGAALYADVSLGHPFYAWINRLTLRGYMSGYDCGGPLEPCNGQNQPYFRPYANATRGQLSKIVANAANYVEIPTGRLFEDVAPPHPFYMWVQRLASRGIIGGYTCGGPDEPCVGPDNRPYFRPYNDVTRGQAAKIVANAFRGGCSLPPIGRTNVEVEVYQFRPQEVTVRVGIQCAGSTTTSTTTPPPASPTARPTVGSIAAT